ncbi:MAG: serine hydrolase domain-containing protein [Butyricicoccus sp.]|nr:serine hydrolase domain-containing protein [Butyricicoccus sp.]
MHGIKTWIRDNQLNVYQLAIQTDGGIVSTAYQPCNACQNIYSVTKVFLNTAIGMLWDEGKLGLDDKLMSYLQPYLDAPYASAWDEITIRHALSHRMGVDEAVIDIDRDDIRTYGTEDHLHYILQHTPKFPAGSYRKYTDSAHYLLSLVVECITGAPADDWIRQKLLQPLHFQHTAWTRCPKNHTIGATGAYMRAEDMVRLGWLYVNRGKFGGTSLVSEAWVDTIEQGSFDLYPVKGSSFRCKGGMNGQMLLYSREKRFAAAWTAYEDDRNIRRLTEYVVSRAEYGFETEESIQH